MERQIISRNNCLLNAGRRHEEVGPHRQDTNPSLHFGGIGVPNLGCTCFGELSMVLKEWTSLTLRKYLDRYMGILV